MLPVSDETKAAWLSEDENRKHVKLEFPQINLELNDSSIIADSLKLTQCLSDSAEFNLSSCISSTFEIEVYTSINLTGKKIICTLSAGTDEDMPIFVGYVKSTTKGTYTGTQKLVCFDELYSYAKFDLTAFYRTNLPMTINAFLRMLGDYIGMPLVDTFDLGPNGLLTIDMGQLVRDGKEELLPQNTSLLGLLKGICSICGCVGYINRSGKFQPNRLRNLGSSTIIMPYHNYCNMADYVVNAPDAVISTNSDSLEITDDPLSPCRAGATNYTAPLVIKGNILALSWEKARRQSAVDTLYAEYANVSFRPFEAEVPSTPWMWVGDKVKLTDYDNAEHEFIVLKRVFTLKSEIISADAAENFGENSLNSDGTVSGGQSSVISIIADDPNKMNKANPTGTGSLNLNGTANGQNSVVAGVSSTTHNAGNVAMGINCVAGNDSSAQTSQIGAVALGNNTKAINRGSTAVGEHTTANRVGQLVCGTYNDDTFDQTDQSKSLFVVGNGSASAKSNAMYVLEDGTAHAEDFVLGKNGKKLSEAAGSQVSVTQKTTRGTNIADLVIDGVTTQLFAPDGGGGASTWDEIADKPFESVSDDFLIENDELKAKERFLTKAEYEALPDTKYSDGVKYYITDTISIDDEDIINAVDIRYDDSETQIGEVNSQGAFEELVRRTNEHSVNKCEYAETTSFSVPIKNGITYYSSYLVLVPHYTSATKVECDLYFIQELGTTPKSLSFTRLVSSGAPTTLSSVTINGNSLDFNFASTIYGYVEIIKLGEV